MSSIKTRTPLVGGSYYHIFNRGINREKVFFTCANYIYFLSLLKKYLVNYMDILAYCLLPNHFHLIVKVRDELETGSVSTQNIQTRSLALPASDQQIGKLASKQFQRMFISYAMAINKQESRVGSLFDAKFKRLEITEQDYLEYAIFYTHYNPEKHCCSNNFRSYKYSSYLALTEKGTTNLNRQLVWDIFGGRDDFLQFHNGMYHEKENIFME